MGVAAGVAMMGSIVEGCEHRMRAVVAGLRRLLKSVRVEIREVEVVAVSCCKH